MTNSNQKTVISMRGVSKYFGGVQAVRDIDLNVAHGERKVLIGTNGAGKTTLFNLIAGDLNVTSGRIELFGHNVTNLLVHRRVRLGIRRTYQTSALFDGLSVRENLYLGLLGSGSLWDKLNIFRKAKLDKSRSQEVVETAGMIGLAERLDTQVIELSHGERRQLEFGQSVITRPRLLLFDEPTAGLSTDERGTMLKLIQGLSRDLTVVLIEHDMDVAFSIADTVTVLHEGRIIAKGLPEEIRKNELVQQIYLGGSVHA
jgi:branched-chain amino acid transport system ATP-binding protein